MEYRYPTPTKELVINIKAYLPIYKGQTSCPPVSARLRSSPDSTIFLADLTAASTSLLTSLRVNTKIVESGERRHGGARATPQSGVYKLQNQFQITLEENYQKKKGNEPSVGNVPFGGNATMTRCYQEDSRLISLFFRSSISRCFSSSRRRSLSKKFCIVMPSSSSNCRAVMSSIGVSSILVATFFPPKNQFNNPITISFPARKKTCKQIFFMARTSQDKAMFV